MCALIQTLSICKTKRQKNVNRLKIKTIFNNEWNIFFLNVTVDLKPFRINELYVYNESVTYENIQVEEVKGPH